MPTTLVGLAIFIALLAPGLIFTLLRERVAPQRKLSVFRETSAVALVSLAADSAALGIFAIAVAARPRLEADVDAFVVNPASYFVANYGQILAWSAGLVVLASLLALLTARALPFLREHAPVTWLVPGDEANAFRSAWGELFHLHDDATTYLQCFLDDGSYLQGPLRSYSRDSEETADRELTIAGRIGLRLADTDELTIYENAAASISARKLSFLVVTYVDRA